MISIERVHRYLADGRWFRRVYRNGHFAIGGQRYYISNQYAVRNVEITFSPEQAAFVCQPQGIKQSIMMETKGLTKADLMGNLSGLLDLPNYQLALPFSVKDRQRLDLARLVSDTIFPDFA